MQARVATIVLVALTSASSAHAGWWTYDDGDLTTAPTETTLRLSPTTSIWTGTFDRPSRACNDQFVDVGIGEQFNPFCEPDNSQETGLGLGAELTFRIAGPFHLTSALQFVYMFNVPGNLKNQVFVPLQLGVMITWPEWTFRPILAGEITPIISITDDTRDFTLGGNAGFAWRVSGFGDVWMTVGHHRSGIFKGWQIRIGLTPL